MSAGIRRIGADHASIIGTLGPVSTLTLAFFVLDETLNPAQLLGSALVLSGVVLGSLAMRKAEQ
jgi:drug/metabolite transporter (DMT)-like permease